MKKTLAMLYNGLSLLCFILGIPMLVSLLLYGYPVHYIDIKEYLEHQDGEAVYKRCFSDTGSSKPCVLGGYVKDRYASYTTRESVRAYGDCNKFPLSVSGDSRFVCVYVPIQMSDNFGNLLKDIFLKFLDDHPDLRHLQKEELFKMSLMEAFPCK